MELKRWMCPHEGSVLPVGYRSLRKELDEKLTAKNCGTYSGNPMLNKRNREIKAGHNDLFADLFGSSFVTMTKWTAEEVCKYRCYVTWHEYSLLSSHSPLRLLHKSDWTNLSPDLNYGMPVESSSYKHEMQVISIICIAFSNTKSFRSLPSLILWERIRYLLTSKMPMEWKTWNSYSWRGVGRVLSKVFYGEPLPSPKVQLLPSYIPFLTEKGNLCRISSIKKWYPFNQPTCNKNKSLKQEVF